MTEKSRELEASCAEFAQWRAEIGGGRGKRIPRALWEQAIAVARVEGVYRTGRATRLQCDRLKALMDEAERSNAQASRTSGATPQFVALPMPASVTRSTVAIELQNHHGDRMRIEHASAAEVSSILTAFLQRSS